MKPAKRDEENVKRKKAKVKGETTFGVTECIMPSSQGLCTCNFSRLET